MASEVPGAGCPHTHSHDIVSSIVFRMIFLRGQSFYYKVHLKRLGAPKCTSPCSADKPISLGSLTEARPYLVITPKSPLICKRPKCFSLRVPYRFGKVLSYPLPGHNNNYGVFLMISSRQRIHKSNLERTALHSFFENKLFLKILFSNLVFAINSLVFSLSHTDLCDH